MFRKKASYVWALKQEQQNAEIIFDKLGIKVVLVKLLAYFDK